MSDDSLTGLAEVLGHAFAKPELLADAVTHPSLMGYGRTARRSESSPYERLEFLGDRVLGLVVAEWLLERFPSEREGMLAKRHVGLVNGDVVGAVAASIGLGQYLRMSPSEEAGGGRANTTILADACEAVIGALFLDGGLEPVRRFIRRAWAGHIERAAAPPIEPKTALQEWAQGRAHPLPVYELVEQSGPAHDPHFKVRVVVEGAADAVGVGSSKRSAEKDAARTMLKSLGVLP